MHVDVVWDLFGGGYLVNNELGKPQLGQQKEYWSCVTSVGMQDIYHIQLRHDTASDLCGSTRKRWCI